MVFILCPANYATGGPELLHQLGYKLNLLGIEASMAYFNQQKNVDPTCPQYRKYRVPVSDGLIDSEEHIVVVPEMSIQFIRRFPEGHKFRVIVWWLSVDNAIYDDADMAFIKESTDIIHLAQSIYALDWLKNTLSVNPERIFYLSDYINTDFLAAQTASEVSERSDTVLFNPQKGLEKTLRLIAFSSAKIKWQVLQGLLPAEMAEVMRQAKVYIDFGFHPGKDRIPREAALCGCCIITNRKGAANNPYDIAIPDCYKFDNDAGHEAVLEQIYELVEHYEEHRADFIPYVENIRKEYGQFEKDVLSVFQTLQPNHIPSFDTPQEYADSILKSIEHGDYYSAYQGLIKYKVEGYEETVDIAIFETAIRMGLQEYKEAELCALHGLGMDAQNYEMYLYLAEINAVQGNGAQVERYGSLAVKYSAGTPDEQVVRARCAVLERRDAQGEERNIR